MYCRDAQITYSLIYPAVFLHPYLFEGEPTMPELCKPILTTKQMLKAEQYTIDNDGISNTQLMELAGSAVARAANQLKLDGGRIVIVVGKGNNAGDGFVAGRLLRQKHIPVTIIPLFPMTQLKGLVTKQAELAAEAGAKIRPATSTEESDYLRGWLKRAVIIVDAIFGTGLTRPLTGWAAEAVNIINLAERPILSIDIASGIESDSGEILGSAIRADATLPISAYKWGHWLQQGRQYGGNILSPANIGVLEETLFNMIDTYPDTTKQSRLINKELIKKALPKRPAQSHKKTFGHLWIFGGSIGYTGAPKLTAMGSQAVGTGLVSIACPTETYPVLASSALEIMVHPQEHTHWLKANAIVAGPGWGGEQRKKLNEILLSKIPVVLDADALNMLATDETVQHQLKQRSSLTVLTPHPGEAGRLLDVSPAEIQQNRLTSSLKLVDKYHTWVVLKGAQTLVVSPDKEVWLNPYGSANLAVGGTGDVLAGVIGGMLASGLSAEIVIPAAVALHGLAGEENSWHRAGQLEGIISNQVQQLRGI